MLSPESFVLVVPNQAAGFLASPPTTRETSRHAEIESFVEKKKKQKIQLSSHIFCDYILATMTLLCAMEGSTRAIRDVVETF